MINSKLRMTVPVLIIALFSVSVSNIHAYFTDASAISVEADSAEVSICVEFTDHAPLSERLQRLFDSREYIFPGDILEKHAYVTSLGTDCFVRVRLETDLPGMTDICSSCDIDRTIWKQAGDYLYLTAPLTGNGGRTTVFSNLHIPDVIGSESSGNTFYIRLTAEAVQARGVSPDFDAPEPWGEFQSDVNIVRESGYL